MNKNEVDRLGEGLEKLSPFHPYGEKKWEIVQAAARLFIQKGSINTGVRDIAEASGITVGTLYHYFKSKDDIIAAFMDFAVYGTENFLKAATEVLDKMGPREALRLAMQRYFEYVDEAQNVVLFWHQETRNLIPELRKRLLDNELVLISLFEHIIERGRKNGVFGRVVDAKLAAHNIIVLADMWAFRRWDLGKHYASKQFIDKQVDFILRSLEDGSGNLGKKSKEVKAGK
jgi:TetR/AcrR family transcriptional regulator, cholesterol catabolism regulator